MSKTSLVKSLDWAVGLFEGEGTIIIRPSRCSSKPGNIEISLSSTDHDVILSFVATIAEGKVYGPYQYADNKPYWKWNAFGDDAAAALIKLRPLFCSRRAYRADEALTAHTIRKNSPYYRVSRKGVGGKPTHRKTNDLDERK